MAQITIASRIDCLPIFSLHRKLTAVLGIGTFFDLYEIFLAGVLGTILTPLYHLDAFGKALIISSGFFGMFFGAIVLGLASDYLGRHTMFLVNIAIYSIFSLAVAFAPSYLWIIIFRFLAGFGLGAEPPLVDIYMGEMIPKHSRGRFTAWAYTIGFLGIPVAGFAGYFLAKTSFLQIEGWRWLFVLGSLGAAIVWFMRRDLPESPRWYEAHNDAPAAERIMKDMEASVLREQEATELPAPEPTTVEVQRHTPLAEIFSGNYTKRTIMLWIFHVLQTVGYYGFGSLAPIILVAKGFTITSSLGYISLIYLGYPLGSLISVPLVERIERKWLIIVSALLIAALGLVFGFANSAITITISGFLLTTTSNLFSNAFHIYQAEIFPTRMRGTAVGIAYSLSRLASGILPLVAIPLLGLYGPVAIFFGAAVLLGMLCLDVAILGPNSTGKTLEFVAQ